MMIDFTNLEIKLAQSFRVAHRNRLYTYIHRSEGSYMYKYLCLYYVLKKTIMIPDAI
jgi:hypothetical protein